MNYDFHEADQTRTFACDYLTKYLAGLYKGLMSEDVPPEVAERMVLAYIATMGKMIVDGDNG